MRQYLTIGNRVISRLIGGGREKTIGNKVISNPFGIFTPSVRRAAERCDRWGEGRTGIPGGICAKAGTINKKIGGINRMRLSNEWFTALSENENGQIVIVSGRDELTEFVQSGKFKERVEITWKYEGDDKGMPSEELAVRMEAVQEALKKAMEKDKLSILTSVYTGGGEKIWVFYTRTVRVFGERLNEALVAFDLLPISIYTEVDPEWEEYLDMYEMKEWSVD